MIASRDEVAEYLFGQGNNYQSQNYFGAHRIDDESVAFRVWAPGADLVCVAGDFNGWNVHEDPLVPNHENGIWTGILKNASFRDGSRYKFVIHRGKTATFKGDPYALYAETLANTASLFCDGSADYVWHDSDYLARRRENMIAPLQRDVLPAVPMNVYEVHLGSWKRHEDGSYLTYHELADQLSDYVKDMGFSYVELMPVMEHPFDGSWGYQICNYFAPTSRFGDPAGFKYFVDTMHRKGIGVILDWVPAHFPKDQHGLYEFDGGPLYEYQGKDRMEHASWGTRCFDVGRTQVQSFLISNALYWLDEFHADGLRVDAVASMLYLDYDRKPGEWNPNPDGSNINRESVAFFRKLNAAVRERFPDCMMIAEESTAFPGVTKQDGLGFNMKWSMGWMNDSLDYLTIDPLFRGGAHHKLTFSTMYCFSESYMLPISHDEVVHGKKSLLDKSFGDYEQKFASTRTFLTYMMTHPGKKLLFMGSEFGQFTEWNEQKSLEWFMLAYDKHKELQTFVKALNHFYLEHKMLWELDQDGLAFKWIAADNTSDNVYAYERFSSDGNSLIVCLNFSANDRDDYRFPVRESGYYKPVFTTDAHEFGGRTLYSDRAVRAVKDGYGGWQLKTKLPALSAVIYIKNRKGN